MITALIHLIAAVLWGIAMLFVAAVGVAAERHKKDSSAKNEAKLYLTIGALLSVVAFTLQVIA